MAHTQDGEGIGRSATPVTAAMPWGTATTDPATARPIQIPITPPVHIGAGSPLSPTHVAETPEPEWWRAATGRKVEGIEFSDEQIEVLKRTIAQGATDDELSLFLYTCKRLRLDPFARQIYFMKRGSQDEKVGRAEVAIDGFRLVAARTGEYCGQTEAEYADVYIDAEGAVKIDWFPVWPFPDRDPFAARVGVLRRGFTHPLYAIARWGAYVQVKEIWRAGQRTGEFTVNAMWKKRGPEQLAKCAEALALRQAFPNELSGVYTSEEMGQADNPEDVQVPEPTPAKRGARKEKRAARTPKEPTKDTKPHAAPAEETPAIVTRYSLLFPFPPHKDVPFDKVAGMAEGATADDPNAPEYVIDDATIAKACDLAFRALEGHEIAGKDGARRAITEAERPKWERLHEVAEAELIRRADERLAMLKDRAQGPDGADPEPVTDGANATADVDEHTIERVDDEDDLTEEEIEKLRDEYADDTKL